MDQHGLRADDLPAIFQRVEESGKRVKLLYTVCWIDCIGLEAQDVRREANKEGAVFPLGSTFFLNQERDDTTHLRLAFSSASLAELERVGPLLKVACDRAVGEG